MKKLFYIIFLAITVFSYAQKTKLDYLILTIPDSLKQNANAVIRSDETTITIKSQRKMVKTQKLVFSVLNKEGYIAHLFSQNYDNKTSINTLQATIYDALGNEIKKIKKSDFQDQSVFDGISIMNDGRVKYMDYTPINYPFTIVYETEIETSNTAFIMPWSSSNYLYYVSTQSSKINVQYPEGLGFKYKTYNFENFPNIKKTEGILSITFEAKDLKAMRYESNAINNKRIFPYVRFALESFHLEGVDGLANNWQVFGQWINEKLIADTVELSPETIQKMKDLVKDETDPIKKAKIIYKYLQDKSRYVSIQMGIGGWKPMPVKDVDRLGYGDCKALSNYTMALLKAVEVPAYYTIIHGDRDKIDLDPDFTAMQGNHVILCIPQNNDYTFLECTSQTSPFGYVANFTDNRYALIIKPEGGQLVKTTHYPTAGNTQKTNAKLIIDANGHLSAEVTIKSAGTQYSPRLQRDQISAKDKDDFYKKYWSNISNLKLNAIDWQNDKEQIIYTEKISFSANEYAKFMGNNLVIIPNALTQQAPNTRKIRDRKTPFEVDRGFVDEDEVNIILPDGYVIESIPQPVDIKTKYGHYKAKIEKVNEMTLKYTRKLTMEEGEYPAADYEDYRQFLEKLNRQDNSKILLLKTK